MNGFTIQSVSNEGSYYLVKNWRKQRKMWDKNFKPEFLYTSKKAVMNGLKKLLNIMTEYATDSFAVIEIKNGQTVSYELLTVKNQGNGWNPDFTVLEKETSNIKKSFEQVEIGDFVSYHYEEFDGSGTVIGGVTEREEDHFILTCDGVNYWIDEDLYSESCFAHSLKKI